MTDKVQKIRDKVEKLKSQLLRGACSSQVTMETRCKEEAYDEVLAILDTMQEESEDDWKYSIAERLGVSKDEFDKMKPVSEPIDIEQEIYKAFGQVKDFTLGMQIAKRFYEMGIQHQEPVSEDLEKEIEKYFANWLQGASDEGCFNANSELVSIYDCHRIARHFTNWQKQKDSFPEKGLAGLINTLSKRYPEVSFSKLTRIAVHVAKWQRERMINKACDWLRSNINCLGWIMNFRKVMEG